ncbi:cytochrome P450 [Nocardia transvalensis]|uniref:Cytochrome P450 n=1 Tax=Nocardia transvalensis TaxID=37333 RepID=A0A7W9PLY6_9NOCA|nr:cytochrome P450 [Nocardia transvalensis]MBB5918370.1 cytochrome P450 [Nocardia transvalensis]
MTQPVIQLPTPGETVLRTYERMRRRGDIVPIELPGGVGAWAAVSHRAVTELLAGDGTSISHNARSCPALHDGSIPADWPMRALTQMEHMLNQDGDEHRRLRRTISKAFTPARVAALEPRIQQITTELVDAFPDGGDPVDLVSAFTTPLPVRVICELFGVPGDEQEPMRDWTSTLVSHTSTAEQMQAAMQDMTGYLAELIERTRRAPGDDLTSALAGDDSGLSTEELVSMLWLAIAAGHETTVHLLGNAIITLCAHPAQLDKARTQDRWADVVEEALRYCSSVFTVNLRFPLRDITIAGTDIPAGAIVTWYGGVGRDPERHPDADVFDIDHDHRDQLAFGRGPHVCLGAPLARLEARIALSTLFTRYPGLSIASDPAELPYPPQFLTSGPLLLPVHLKPAA